MNIPVITVSMVTGLDITINVLTLTVLQWSTSKTDTIKEVKFVLYKKVSFIQGSLNVILMNFGTYTNVLYIKGVLTSGVSF